MTEPTALGRLAALERAEPPMPDFQRDPTILEIQSVVCRHFNMPMIEMRSARRARAVARPRQVAMFLCRRHTALSLPAIGRLFGNRDHTTVMHAVALITDLVQRDAGLAADVAALGSELAGGVRVALTYLLKEPPC